MKTLIDHALELFAIVKAGELLEKKSRALWLAGQILVLASEFFPEAIPFGDSASDDLEELIAQAEAEIAAADPEAATVNPIVVALVTRVIVLVLRRLLS